MSAGVVAYTTARRTKEFGVRCAVGATAGEVTGLVFRQGFITVGGGLALGAIVAEMTIRTLQGFVMGLEAPNAGYIWVAVGVVAVTAALACWIPARRASRMDSYAALRQE